MAEQVKVSHTLDSDLMAAVESVADAEQRSRSNMIAVLLREALDARQPAQEAVA